MTRKSWVVVPLILFSLYPPGVHAATINAASCSQANVQTAVNSASAGDTVAVPAGTCNWTTTSGFTQSVTCGKAITLQGSGIDVTTIRDETGSNSGENPLKVQGGCRVTGFTFTDMKRTSSAEPAINASGNGWRIDHNKLFPNNSDPGRGMSVSGNGLVDHNTFQGTKQGIEIYYDGTGDTSWTSVPQQLGSANATYIEDNVFNYAAGEPLDGAYDAYDGARYVFRHNTLNGTNLGHHGTDSGYPQRSTHSFEIYDNTFTNTGSHIAYGMDFRGGSGVVFNNTMSGTGGSYDTFVWLVSYRSDSGYTDAGPWGICDGSNSRDQNTPGGQGYACQDQIGRTTGQALSGVYFWNNTYKGGAPTFGVRGYSNDTRVQTFHILVNRDFYTNTQRPGYTPYTYPHPLQGGGTGPQPPGGLTAVVH